MKRLPSIALLALLLTTFGFSYGLADRVSAKSIIREGQGQGVAVEVIDVASGRLLSPKSAFSSGQAFRLQLQTSFSGHIYITNVSPSGKRTQVYPVSNENNFHEAGQIVIPPAQSSPFRFDNERGLEILEVSLSPTTIKAYEEARYQPQLAPAAELVGYQVPSSSGFANSSSAKGISRDDGYTFPSAPQAGEMFRFTVALQHN